MSDIKFKKDGKKVNIYTPYLPEFINKIKNIGGAKWDALNRCWTIPAVMENDARKIVLDIYGYDDKIEDEKITVQASIKYAITERCSPVILFNKIIASASGRDSGAIVGNDVVFLKGGCDSSGSMKNWETYIKADSEIKIYNVSKKIYESEIEKVIEKDLFVDIKIINQDVDIELLKEEKDRLLKRIKEIDNILNNN